MAQIILIIGETGTGKSSSIENIDGKTSMLINCIGKELPYRGSKKQFQKYDFETKSGNMFIATDSEKIEGILRSINDKKPEINLIIIDDFQYVLSYEFIERAKETGWNKFNDIAQHAFNVIDYAKNLRDDLKVVFLWHQEDVVTETNKMKSKVKTVGKLLDDKITIEGLFTIVLFTKVTRLNKEVKYQFVTQSDGITTAKSPKGMFEYEIPNDLDFVIKTIDQYYKE